MHREVYKNLERRKMSLIMIFAECSPGSALALLLLFVKTLIVGLATDTYNCPLSKQDCTALVALELDGYLSFSNTADAARDFGSMRHEYPSAVLYPSSVKDIAAVVRTVYASPSNLTIAAKGSGHSIHGQAQALNGIVIEMSALRGIHVFPGAFGESPYVDAAGGELWIDVLRATLKMGLAPRSMTDYLYLSVGGTLSNAGVSGQAFRYGPQISNVNELEVVTGIGDIVTCSPFQNADLFFAVLGGLGQFGIITRARIILEAAPNKVKWIRALYSDFTVFTRDQEILMSQAQENSFDYIEGSVIVNSKDRHGWKSVPFEGQIINASLIPDTAGPVLYCLELTKNYHDHEVNTDDKKVSSLLEHLGHLPSLIFSTDVPYLDFLDRVHVGEERLRKLGLWDVPHPWMNLFIPKSRITDFDAWVFKKHLRDGINGPLLVYPLDRMKWDSRMSAVTPNEDIFYLVGLLRYASLSSAASVESLLNENKEVTEFCRAKGIGYKQYLPHYSTQEEWSRHFGFHWLKFVDRKLMFDPKAILSPGQRIFIRKKGSFEDSNTLIE
ncbi:hypothetical protein O6H91_02G123000 [Diphasiastrum complanatum]|uniref:Uncharacterized protein n=1 Tax=Diphasiastrum complanatum TaxID=34168 RepID=A0ACC2EK72_DIPCM|nr:hypothetical protein O6H91_02G123000 [Diphasiastrum complanatum]